MKNLITLFILSVISSAAFATQTRYCDDMARTGNLPRLNEGQFAQVLKDKEPVDRILVSKKRRQLYLIKNDVILKTYFIALGMDPLGGAKQFEGDSRTPEGLYTIDSKNPNSAYYLSLHVSYPNAADIANAKKIGRPAGGDIMVHGFPVDPIKHSKVVGWHPNDWTQGCMAVTDKEINEIYSLVKEGTTIEICSVPQN